VHWLRKELPIHMVPRRFRHLDTLPRNPNGKADRGRLRELLTLMETQRLMTRAFIDADSDFHFVLARATGNPSAGPLSPTTPHPAGDGS